MKKKEVTIDEMMEAYIKLKTHIYYDTTELFQREALAQFETDLKPLTNLNEDNPYVEGPLGIFMDVKLNEKLEKLVSWINNLNEDNFKPFYDKIDLICLPKKFEKKEEEENFLTNQRISETYTVERTTVFASFPIELHLISVLWLMKYGFVLDARLNEHCVGNRLLLNRNKDALVKGSSLFKPYFTQYQRWRDNAVDEARRKLAEGSDVAFVNVDLKDYFYSARINFSQVEEFIGLDLSKSNLHSIFKAMHTVFTDKLISKKYPYPEVATEIKGRVVLPIGLPSSYTLGNWYLRDFDTRVMKLIPKVYYSRYVDDILIVIENPDFDFHEKEKCIDIKFSFDKYKKNEIEEPISFNDTDITNVERFLLETLYPVVKLVDYPNHFITANTEISKDQKRIFKITCVEGAYFQGIKTLVYFFDKNESTAVIDKLKQELEERASEFRDFPEDDPGEGSFDEQAYHLIFEGTEGKIRTLKDYKENRYGLSVFLANRIFAALRRVKKVNKAETEKILKLFKGINNLEHFRLWEKIFTFFLVNEDRQGFVTFYKHTFDQIEKLSHSKGIQNSGLNCSDVSASLFKYFDIALEMALALHPKFLVGSKEAKDLEIFQNSNQKHEAIYRKIILTGSDSRYITRFRRSNLIRHHYVAHPLLNYTRAARMKELNLVLRHLPDNKKISDARLDFSPELKTLSPRRVKFWECCLAVVNKEMLTNTKASFDVYDGRYQYSKIFAGNPEDKNFILQKAFDLFYEINRPHFTSDEPTSDAFYQTVSKLHSSSTEKDVRVNEMRFPFDRSYEEGRVAISIANTDVKLSNIEASIKGKPLLTQERYEVFAKLLNQSRKEKADVFVLPEFSVPYEFVPSLAKFAEKNQLAIVAGLEHWTVEDVSYNYIITVIPVVIDGISDAVVLYRLKNHYAHIEELIIRGYGLKVPKPAEYRYDLINWRNLYFTSFYCFELADTFHRSLFRAKIDLLVASEWNKDVPYFSNIVEALSRDLHCYIVQVNTSVYGDSRVTQPSDTAKKDIMKLKGGRNDTILVGDIYIKKLREFQLKHFERVKADKDDSFKPLPPDWERKFVQKRIDNLNIYEKETPSELDLLI